MIKDQTQNMGGGVQAEWMFKSLKSRDEKDINLKKEIQVQ